MGSVCGMLGVKAREMAIRQQEPRPGIQDKGLVWRPDHGINELKGTLRAVRRRKGEEETQATPALGGS